MNKYDLKNDVKERDTVLMDTQQLAKERQEEIFNRNKNKLEDRTRTLFDKAMENLEKYGPEDYRTQMMMDFLYVCDEIKEVIYTIDSVQTMFLFMDEAMCTFDSVLKLNNEILVNSLSSNYGFLARIKQKRRMKKAIRNNNNRVKSMIMQIEGLFQMTQDMSVSVRGAMERIRGRLSYQRTRMEKLKSKGKVSAAVSTENSSVEVFNKYAKQYNVDVTNIGAGNGSTDSAPKPAGSGDDISDILS